MNGMVRMETGALRMLLFFRFSYICGTAAEVVFAEHQALYARRCGQ